MQHKQIRPSDQQHRDNAQGFYGGGDGFPRGGYSSHLPPSGPMAAQNMAPWYEAQKEPPHSGGPGVEDGAGEQVRPENTATHSSPLPEGGGDAVAGEGEGMTPLSNLEPLRNALPDE